MKAVLEGLACEYRRALENMPIPALKEVIAIGGGTRNPHLMRIKAAVAGVDRKKHADTDNLVISRVFVDGGPTTKRMQPHAMGRAFRIRKRSCHITIELGE